MKSLQECIVVDKFGKPTYHIDKSLALEEKRRLVEEFVGWHCERKSSSVNMHMTKRSMPFALHGRIVFRGSKLAVNKLNIYFNVTSIGMNIIEQTMVWDAMKLVKAFPLR